ncbi:MAG: SDR family oxidoreductase [Pseudomonadota bacterium]
MKSPENASTIAVIGACGGIGRALVSSLSTAGHRVVALDLPSSLERHPPDVAAIPIDVLSANSIASATASLAGEADKLDGVVNLAGYTRGVTPLAETDAEAFDDTVAGNLRGIFLSTQALLPRIAKGGSIVLVSSGLAQFIRPGHGAYAASKAGVIALAKTFALESAPSVRVNAVAPGPVQTAFLTGGTGRSDEDRPSIVHPEQFAATVPMGRIAEPQDVVGPIEFLLGPQSGFMTGQVLWVNGGAYMP